MIVNIFAFKNMERKELLRNFLYRGCLNVEMYYDMKDRIMSACGMSELNAKDRANWSNWINCKCAPNRFCQAAIDNVLESCGYARLYKVLPSEVAVTK